MRQADGAWVGWSGDAGDGARSRSTADGMHLVRLGLSETEVRHFYEGFCNATLWPLYHDVIAPPEFHRPWWEAYVDGQPPLRARPRPSRRRRGATVWVHDYQLQLVPADAARAARPDLRIGFFNHIPFPGYEIFAQLPWRRQIVEGLLGADLLGFQRRAGRHQLPARLPPGRRPDHRGGRPCGSASRDGLAGRSSAARVPDLDRRGRASSEIARRRRRPGPRRARSGRRSATPRPVLLGRRPAGLHQGHPAPAQGLRRAAGRRAARPAGRGARPGRQPEPGAGRAVPGAARRGRGDGRPDQRRVRRGWAARRCTTCTSPTRGRRWPRCTSPPT